MLRRDLQSRRPLDYKSSGSPEKRFSTLSSVWKKSPLKAGPESQMPLHHKRLEPFRDPMPRVQ